MSTADVDGSMLLSMQDRAACLGMALGEFLIDLKRIVAELEES